MGTTQSADMVTNPGRLYGRYHQQRVAARELLFAYGGTDPTVAWLAGLARQPLFYPSAHQAFQILTHYRQHPNDFALL